jgi:hypothetical protein
MSRCVCPDCGTPLTCQRCHLSRAGQAGGAKTSKAKAAAARRASRAPRPTRRAYDLDWSPVSSDLPERATLAQASRLAADQGVRADLIEGGKVVGKVDPDGSWSLRP